LSNQSAVILAVLAALAAAAQALAPAHWVPASVMAWQRGWSVARSGFFAAIALVLHVLLGVAIFFIFEDTLVSIRGRALAVFTLLLIGVALAVRLVRFPRMNEVFRAGPNGAWSLVSVLWILGPCELIIPVLIKARQVGIGYLVPLVSFGAATLVVGVATVVAGRIMWNKPLLLPRGISWGTEGRALLPVLAGLAIGLGAMLRLA